jgi:hypothetical protein
MERFSGTRICLCPEKMEEASMGVPHKQTRPPGSLQARLLAMARIARRKAEPLPESPIRWRLLQMAEQSERSAAMERWLSSPGRTRPR